MRKILFYFRLYCKIASQYIKARMQYRIDFFIGMVGAVFYNITAVLFLLVIFKTIPVLTGYGFNELLFMYAFYLLAGLPAQFFFDNIWQLRRHLQEGTFIKYYFKPLNMMFFYMSDSMDLKSVGTVFLGIGVLCYSSFHLHIQWDIFKILLFLASLAFASLIVISLMVISASTGFWLLNPTTVMTFTNKLREHARYPITIFNNFFKFIFTFIIPLGFIAFYPLQIFFYQEKIPFELYLTPLIGIVFFRIACVLWKKGANIYSGTGS